MRISDWSSDVCSSDLLRHRAGETPMTPSSMTNPIANPGQFAAEADVRAMLHDPRIVAARAPIEMLFARGHGDRIPDRKSVVSGQSVSLRVDLGGRRIIKKKTQ